MYFVTPNVLFYTNKWQYVGWSLSEQLGGPYAAAVGQSTNCILFIYKVHSVKVSRKALTSNLGGVPSCRTRF
jgi:hypothetical protein